MHAQQKECNVLLRTLTPSIVRGGGSVPAPEPIPLHRSREVQTLLVARLELILALRFRRANNRSALFLCRDGLLERDK